MADEFPDPISRSWDEYVTIALQRRWWIVLPIFICWLGAWAISLLMPATYESEATVSVERQKVPDLYVTPNVTTDLQGRLQNITQQILSRPRLEFMIERFHLYAPHRGLGALLKPDDPVDEMRDDIGIHLVESPGRPGDFSAFKIRYSAKSPEVAEEIDSELASLFVSENVSTQRQLSQNTNDFLATQLAGARTKMEAQEAQVAAFKVRHAGELPSQVESNVQILSGLQSQLANTQHALDAAKQQKIYLESLQQQYASLGGAMTETQELSKEIADLQRQLQDLHSIYTDTHPDIVAMRDEIEQKKTALRDARAQEASSRLNPSGANGTDSTMSDGFSQGSPTTMMQIQSQLKANQLEIQNYDRGEKALETEIASYRSRLNLTPQTEQELTDISRGYEEAKANYDSLLQKQMQSQLATSLDQRQQGERFTVIDPPTLPNKPVSPDRLMISLAGLALGTFCGLGLTALLEVTDSRVRREKDLEGIVPARLLVTLPRLVSPGENRIYRTKSLLELGAGTAMALVILIGNLYVLYRG